MAEVVLEAGPHVAVAGLPGPLGVQRREPPVLAEREVEVGRSADAGLAHEAVLVVPHVEAVVVGADREVQGEQLAAALDPVAQRTELTLHDPLAVEVEALLVEIPLTGGELANGALAACRRGVAQPFRPRPPAPTVAGGHRPEAGVAGDDGEALEEGAVAGVARPAGSEERPGRRLQVGPLPGPDRRVVDEPVRAEGRGIVAPRGCGRRRREVVEVVEVGVQLVPHLAAERGVGAVLPRRCGVAVELGGQEGEGHDRVPAPPVEPVEQRAEVGDVHDAVPAGPRGAQRVERQEHPPAPLPPWGWRPGDPRCGQHGGLCPPVRSLHHEAVRAERQRGAVGCGRLPAGAVGQFDRQPGGPAVGWTQLDVG